MLSARTALGRLGVGLFVAGIYTQIHLFVQGSLLVPYVVSGPVGLLLLVANRNSIRRQEIRGLLLVFLLMLASLVSNGTDEFFTERAKSALQFSYSLVIVYGLFLELRHWKRVSVARLWLGSALVILTGAVLERLTDLHRLSNAFRAAVYPPNQLYDALERDIGLFGFIRPTLFTAEPSYVALFFVLSVTVWLALSEHRAKYLLALSSCVAGVLVLGSPIVLLLFPIVVVSFIYLECGGVRKLLADSRKPVSLALLFMIGIASVGASLNDPTRARIRSMVAGQDGSTVIRIIAPPLITADVLSESPFVGVGIGAREKVVPFIDRRLVGQFGLDYLVASEVGLQDKLTNAFWLHWIYFGAVLGLLMIWAIARLILALGGRSVLYVLLTLVIFGQMMGAYVGALLWTICFMLTLASGASSRPVALTPDLRLRG